MTANQDYSPPHFNDHPRGVLPRSVFKGPVPKHAPLVSIPGSFILEFKVTGGIFSGGYCQPSAKWNLGPFIRIVVFTKCLSRARVSQGLHSIALQ